MNAKAFITTTLLSALLMTVLYGYSVDKILGHSRDVPYSYKQFLLEETTEYGPRVIVDSGSNSVHAVNPEMLSEYFRGPVIITADNAGIPLRNRLHNLINNSRPGDVIILPLEWHYYVSDGYVSVRFTDFIADEERRYQHYFAALPFWERVGFIFSKFPLGTVLDSLQYSRDPYHSIISDLQRLSYFGGALSREDFSRLGGVNRNGPEEPNLDLSTSSCDERLFSKYHLGSEFEGAFDLLQQIRNKGVSVYFMWPAVADLPDYPCYQDPRRQAVFASIIRRKIEEEGFQIFGNYRDFKHGGECFLDTRYHIKTRCADSHTEHMISLLAEGGVQPVNAGRNTSDFLAGVSHNINHYRNRLTLRMYKLQVPLAAGKYEGNQLESTILPLSEGWWKPEDWGVWSRGKQSSFTIKLAKELVTQRYVTLSLTGRYLDKEEKTGVKINGRDFGGHVLRVANFKVPSEMIQNERLQVQLSHSNPVSPKELVNSPDTRKMKYGFMGIAIQ